MINQNNGKSSGGDARILIISAPAYLVFDQFSMEYTSCFSALWLDSKEAQSTYRSVSLRRANSCSQIDHFEFDVSMDPARFGSLHELVANPLRTKTTRGDALDSSINPSLHLLSQLAVFCLMEHASRSDKAEGSTLSKRPSSQLTSVCQRLQIPCQFTDHQLKSAHLEKVSSWYSAASGCFNSHFWFSVKSEKHLALNCHTTKIIVWFGKITSSL